MRQDAGYFGETELELVLIARRVKEAGQVEAVLTDAGFDYFVEPDRYRGTLLGVLPTERVGAFFYVPSDRAAPCRELLASRKFQVVEVEGENA